MKVTRIDKSREMIRKALDAAYGHEWVRFNEKKLGINV